MDDHIVFQKPPCSTRFDGAYVHVLKPEDWKVICSAPYFKSPNQRLYTRDAGNVMVYQVECFLDFYIYYLRYLGIIIFGHSASSHRTEFERELLL